MKNLLSRRLLVIKSNEVLTGSKEEHDRLLREAKETYPVIDQILIGIKEKVIYCYASIKSIDSKYKSFAMFRNRNEEE